MFQAPFFRLYNNFQNTYEKAQVVLTRCEANEVFVQLLEVNTTYFCFGSCFGLSYVLFNRVLKKLRKQKSERRKQLQN